MADASTCRAGGSSQAQGCKPTGGRWAATDLDASPAHGVVPTANSSDANAVTEKTVTKLKRGSN